MSSKIITAAVLCVLAGAAQAETPVLKVTSDEIEAAVKVAEVSATAKADALAQAPAKDALDAVKDAPPAIVSGSVTVTPTIDVPAVVSASIPVEVSSTAEVSASAAADAETEVGVTTLDEAFAAISASAALEAAAQPETTTMEGHGEKLEDYMKDAARPASEPADGGVIPMPSDGDDMMGY